MVRVKGIIIFEIGIVIENSMFGPIFYRISGILGISRQFPKTKYNMRLMDRLMGEKFRNGKISILEQSLLMRARNVIIANGCA